MVEGRHDLPSCGGGGGGASDDPVIYSFVCLKTSIKIVF